MSDGAGQHNAATAWSQGATGAGVAIAVIDTGIDFDSPEFAGRLSPNSIDVAGNRSLEGPDNHGTLVALTAAGARNNRGILGIAFDSTVLAVRADAPGTCSAGGTPGVGCGFSDVAIADGINHAVSNGARVINLSLGGGTQASLGLRAAIRNAANAGALIVISSGNEGAASLDGFASSFVEEGNGSVLVVGSVDENYDVSSFSTRAGTQTDFFISARGEFICCDQENGELLPFTRISGTSFAAPQVAGAAALLAQAFPNLTGSQIAEILLESAFDAGEAGADSEFGQGILDLGAAFRPIGTTSIAGSRTPLALGDIAATGSPVIGDALANASIPTLVTDRFDRAFSVDLGGTLRAAAPRQLLHGALAGSQRHVSGAVDGASVAFSIDNSGHAAPLRLSFDEGERAQVLAAQVALRLDASTQLAFGYASSGQSLAARLRDADQPAFLIASDAPGSSGIYSRSDTALAVRHTLGKVGLTVSAESGVLANAPGTRRLDELRGLINEDGLARFGLTFDRAWQNFDLAIGAAWLAEENSLLGTRFHDGFGLAGADSVFLDSDLRWKFAPAWQLGASWREGLTRPRAAALVAGGDTLRTRAWAFDVARRGVFARGDALALRVSQPLRVEGGTLGLNLPVAFDALTLTPELGRVPVSLTPGGRELLTEVSWSGAFLGGYASTSAFFRKEPGHNAALQDDAGVALRWSRGF